MKGRIPGLLLDEIVKGSLLQVSPSLVMRVQKQQDQITALKKQVEEMQRELAASEDERQAAEKTAALHLEEFEAEQYEHQQTKERISLLEARLEELEEEKEPPKVLGPMDGQILPRDGKPVESTPNVDWHMVIGDGHAVIESVARELERGKRRAEYRVAELERELAWLRKEWRFDGVTGLEPHLDGLVVYLSSVKAHLASKPPADWKP